MTELEENKSGTSSSFFFYVKIFAFLVRSRNANFCLKEGKKDGEKPAIPPLLQKEVGNRRKKQREKESVAATILWRRQDDTASESEGRERTKIGFQFSEEKKKRKRGKGGGKNRV